MLWSGPLLSTRCRSPLKCVGAVHVGASRSCIGGTLRGNWQDKKGRSSEESPWALRGNTQKTLSRARVGQCDVRQTKDYGANAPQVTWQPGTTKTLPRKRRSPNCSYRESNKRSKPMSSLVRNVQKSFNSVEICRKSVRVASPPVAQVSWRVFFIRSLSLAMP